MTSYPHGRRITDRPEHRARLLVIKRENLERLQVQAARHGPLDVPLELQNAIAQLEADIAALEAASQPSGPSDEVVDTLGPTGQYRAMYMAIMGLQAQFVELRTLTLRWMIGLTVAVVSLALVVSMVAVEVWR